MGVIKSGVVYSYMRTKVLKLLSWKSWSLQGRGL